MDNFVEIPIYLQQHKALSNKAKYFFMCWYVCDHKVGAENVTIPIIANEMNCTIKSANKYLQELKKHGFIIADKGYMKIGYKK